MPAPLLFTLFSSSRAQLNQKHFVFIHTERKTLVNTIDILYYNDQFEDFSILVFSISFTIKYNKTRIFAYLIK